MSSVGFDSFARSIPVRSSSRSASEARRHSTAIAFGVVPGFKVTAIDTTGAGDHFRAGFIHGVIQGWPIADILRFANATAAVSCTKRGAIASAPTLAEVERLLALPRA